MERYKQQYIEAGGFKKIDVYYKGKYLWSTNSFKNQKEAIKNAIEKNQSKDSDKDNIKNYKASKGEWKDTKNVPHVKSN